MGNRARQSGAGDGVEPVSIGLFRSKDDRAVALPFHTCQVRATFEGSGLTMDFDKVRLGPEMEPTSY